MTVDSTLARAKEAVEKDRLWRAKEILGSSITTYGYSRKIFRAYAEVLMRMGDDLEAGRFLILSVDSPNEAEMKMISLFVARFGGDDYKQLLGRFPQCCRLKNRDGYPSFLQSHFVDLGAPEKFVVSPDRSAIARNTVFDRLFPIGCVFIALSILASATVGAIEILSWFWGS